MKHSIPNMTYSEIEHAINERIVGKNAERDRAILRRRLLKGVTFERLAEEFDLSVRQVYNIVYKRESKIFR